MTQTDNRLRVIQSQQDLSHNFVEERLAGFLESRYVRKCDDYFVCYLSSHTGCNRGCAFCHLTATGQTSFTHSTTADFRAQAERVFAHYRAEVAEGRQPSARYVHFSFMARGEPLANSTLVHDGAALLTMLGNYAAEHSLPAKFCVSTIMPQTFLSASRSLADCFGWVSPTIYYSLYSVDEGFRRKWMPTAMPVADALRILADYQRFSKKIVKIHYALIEGENDGEADVDAVCSAIAAAGLLCEFNLVRYNPASDKQGRESPEETRAARLEQIRRSFAGKVAVIPRVGFDAKASCGMFVGGGAEAGFQLSSE